MKLLCLAPCGTKFEIKLTMPMPIDAFVKKMKETRCPKCGNKDKLGLLPDNKPGTYGL